MLRSALAILPVVALASPAHGIVGGVKPDFDDLRFDAVAAFSKPHWLGMDGTDHNSWWCSATLVAPDIILTATHCVDLEDPGPYAVRFRRHRDGTLGSIDAGPSSFHHAYVDTIIDSGMSPMNGVIMGVLREPVTHIEPIPGLLMGTADLTAGTAIIHAGWGIDEYGEHDGLRLCDNDLTMAGSHEMRWTGIAANGCGPADHDSGSAILLERDSELRVIAVPYAHTIGINLTRFLDRPDFDVPRRGFSGTDVYVSGVELSGLLLRGVPHPIEIDLANGGESLASGTVEYRAHLSRDRVWGNDDDIVVLSRRTRLPAPRSHTSEAVELELPATLPPGAYELAVSVYVDVDETIDSNNTRWHTHLTGVTPARVRQASLTGGIFFTAPDIFDIGFHALEHPDGTLDFVGLRPSRGRSYIGRGVAASPDGSFSFVDREASIDMRLATEPSQPLGTLQDEATVQLIGGPSHIEGSAEYCAGFYSGHVGVGGAAHAVVAARGMATLVLENGSDGADGGVAELTLGWPTTLSLQTETGATIDASLEWSDHAATYRLAGTITGSDGTPVPFELLREPTHCSEDSHCEFGQVCGPDTGRCTDGTPQRPSTDDDEHVQIATRSIDADSDAPLARTTEALPTSDDVLEGGCAAASKSPLAGLLSLLLIAAIRRQRK